MMRNKYFKFQERAKARLRGGQIVTSTSLYNFGSSSRIANLFIRTTLTNYFFTLTDLKEKAFFTFSAGMMAQTKNKRLKKSPATLEKMMAYIRLVLKSYKIHRINVVMRSKLRGPFKQVVSNLVNFGISINEIIDRRIVAHNGVRKRGIKRK